MKFTAQFAFAAAALIFSAQVVSVPVASANPGYSG